MTKLTPMFLIKNLSDHRLTKYASHALHMPCKLDSFWYCLMSIRNVCRPTERLYIKH